MRLPCVSTALVLLALSPGWARAGALRLTWLDCGDGGVVARTFACDTNAGSEVLYATFTPDSDFIGVEKLTAQFELAISIQSFPSWWTFGQSGDCREAAFSLSGDVSPGPSCVPWAPVPVAATITSRTFDFTHTGYWIEFEKLSFVPVPAYPIDISGGGEQGLFRLSISHAGTVGAGSCPGCGLGICMDVRYVWAWDGAGRNVGVVAPQFTGFAFWQGGTHGCEDPATPARRDTWGGIKSLYR